MPEIGPVELIIVAFVVLLLFGPGKAADLGSSLGKSIREFRRESARDGGDSAAAPSDPPARSVSSLGTPSADAGTSGAASLFCTNCGSRNSAVQKFCTSCGTSMAAPA